MGYKDKEKRNAYMREYRKKNPEKIVTWNKNRKRNTPEGMRKFLDWQIERRKKYKEKILKLKRESNGCKKCGWKNHSEILQYHHKDKSTKKFKMSVGNLASYKWESVLEEIAKCDLLCPNCHFWLHYQESGLLGLKLTNNKYK